MKRAHRLWHRRVWSILLLCSAVAVGLALLRRPATPQNPVWPPTLATEST